MDRKSPAQMLAEKWNRNDFEQAFCKTFKVNSYSEDLGLIVRQLWLKVLTGKKRSAAKGLVEFLESHGKVAGWHDMKSFIDAIAPLAIWLLLDIARTSRKEREDCPENHLFLEGLAELFLVQPIEEMLDQKTLRNHRELTGEEPSAASVLLLLQHHLLLTPPGYLETRMKNTRYKSMNNYTKALISHSSSIIQQLNVFLDSDHRQPS